MVEKDNAEHEGRLKEIREAEVSELQILILFEWV
jgi:hypothetical protein